MAAPTSIRFPDVETVKAAADAAGMKLNPWVVSACEQVAELEAAQRALAAGEALPQYVPKFPVQTGVTGSGTGLYSKPFTPDFKKGRK